MCSIELPVCQVGLAQNAVCFEVVGVVVENMLCQTDRLVEVITFEPLPSLVVGRLQAYACHLGSPAAKQRSWIQV